MKIKRYLSIFFMIVFCFLMQTTVLSHFKLTNIIPNLLVIMTSASGFMFGRRWYVCRCDLWRINGSDLW